MNKKVVISIAIILILNLVGVGVYRQVSKKQKKQTIKIGVILPITGSMSKIGEPEKKAIEIFKQHSPSLSIELIDFQSQPKIAVSTYNNASLVSNPDLFILSTSAAYNSLKELFFKNQEVAFVNSSLPGVTNGTNFYRIGPNSTDEVSITIDSLLFYTDNAEVIIPNNDLGNKIKDEIILRQRDDQKMTFQSYNLGQIDYKEIINKIKDPRTVVFEGYPNDIPVFLRQLGEIKKNKVHEVILPMTAIWLPMELLKNYPFRISFPVPELYYNVIYKGEQPQNEKLKIMITEYVNRFHQNPNYDELYIWETLNYLDYFAQKYNGFNKNNLQKDWNSGSIPGLNGPIETTTAGDVKVKLEIMRTK